MKPGTRFLGIDDSSHDKFKDETAFLIGVTYRGTDFVEDVRKTSVDIDGDDATQSIIEIYESAEASEIGYILLGGVSFAGLNIAELQRINEETDKPVIAVTKNQPDREKFLEALENVGHEEKFRKLEKPSKLELEEGKVFLHFTGCSESEAEKAVKNSTLQGLTPEPIRVADMIGEII
jgi:endonuclease V-like protein UPF0215 family